MIIVYGNKCLPIDDKIPRTSDRVRECMTKERFDKELCNRLTTMKDDSEP